MTVTGRPAALLTPTRPARWRSGSEIADIFQALSQERPYRTALEAEEVMQHLENLATLGRVDAGLTRLVRQHLGTCRQLACRD